MAWNLITYTNYLDAIAKITAFITRTKQPGSVAYSGTGDGIVFGLSTTANSVTENFVVKCTTAGAAAVFSVVGSVSGNIGNATVNIPFVHDKICFTIIAGAVNFASNDEFDFSVANGTPNWTAVRNVVGDGATLGEKIFCGIGGGSDTIYVGLKEVTNRISASPGTYFNLHIQGFSGFQDEVSPGNKMSFESQPGYQAGPYSCLTNGNGTIHILESARRILLFPHTTNDGSAHAGWIKPVATPSQWPYPMFVGGDTMTATTLDSGSRGAFWKTKANNRMYNNAAWDSNSDTWPYQQYTPVKDANGNFPLLPLTVINMEIPLVGRAVYGEVEGCYAVSADGTTVTNADTIVAVGPTGNREFYIIVKNIGSTGDGNLLAVKLT